jgi:TPR repeat protein
MLANALVRDATGADALPLLAFTLARLFGDFAAEGRLTHEGYVAVGGTAGSISRALGEATVAAGAVGSLAHQRRLLVPALVTWDPEAADGKGAAKRLPAHEGTLLAGPRADLAPLAKALVDVRLLRRDRETLEVAHEALLRVPPISDWLEEDRELLIWRDRTAKARAAYEANARGVLVGLELDIARTWLKARGHAAEIDAADLAFIEASIVADELQRSEEARRERALQAAQLEAALAREQAAEAEVLRAREREAAAQERAVAARRTTQRTRAGLVAATLLALAASVATWVAYWQRGEAVRNAEMAGAAQKLAQEQGQKEHEAYMLVEILFSQDPAGMVSIGYLYEIGYPSRGLPQDYTKARQWYEKAAAARHPGAKRALGRLYANGWGVSQDFTKADQWFKEATAGDAMAMAEIGQLYAKGQDVPQNDAKVREWFERAAAAGYIGALGKLAWHALLLREFEQALDAAERALRTDPELLGIQCYRAHALMLLNKAAEARALYLAHKDKQIAESDNRTWQQMVGDDFAELSAAGIEHPLMAEIKTALGIGKR